MRDIGTASRPHNYITIRIEVGDCVELFGICHTIIIGVKFVSFTIVIIVEDRKVCDL